MEDDRKLWQEYRNAWETYTRKHDALQCLIDSVPSENSLIDLAVLERERARMAHSAARDRLAKHLNHRDATAEGDSLRAGNLVRSAAQTLN
jgi:hypothetical protein